MKERPSMKESVHASKLLELGFEKVDKTPGETITRRVETIERFFGSLLKPKERRDIKGIVKAGPSFTRGPTIIPPITRVTDELGQEWIANRDINLEELEELTSLGFVDNTKRRQDAGSYPGKKPGDQPH